MCLHISCGYLICLRILSYKNVTVELFDQIRFDCLHFDMALQHKAIKQSISSLATSNTYTATHIISLLLKL